MDLNNPDLPENDPKYAVGLINIRNDLLKGFRIKCFNNIKGFDKSVLPRTECLKDTVERFLPFWHDQIVPSLKVL